VALNRPVHKKRDDMRNLPVFFALALIPLQAFADAPVVQTGQSFRCTPTHVWDGDGPVWCAEGPKLRLSGINARETDGSCTSGHPCPSKDAKWSDARDFLVELVGTPTGRQSQHGHILVNGPTMDCVSVGPAGRDRTGAWCVSPKGGDLSCAMVDSGLAAKWAKFWQGHICRN